LMESKKNYEVLERERCLKYELSDVWNVLISLNEAINVLECVPNIFQKITKLVSNGKIYIIRKREAFHVWIEGKEFEKKESLKTFESKKKELDMKKTINKFAALSEKSEKSAEENLLQDYQICDDYENELGYDSESVGINRISRYMNEELIEFCEELENSIKDPYSLKIEQRRKIVEKIRIKYQNLIKIEISKLIETINNFMIEKNQHSNDQKLKILQGSKLIGMTSTGAALNRDLLMKLKSPVYIFEEAGELLESQLVSCLHENVQHMILIGDEQQLRPKVSSYNLEKNYNFAISLFERLTMRNFSMSTLLTQKRMRPEISKIMETFYPGLKDHDCVKEFPDVEGMTNNLHFITHNKLETESIYGSKSNEYEAEFICNLAMYLKNQKSYTENDITIITPYSGQQLIIKSKLNSRNVQIRTVSVDDFQGEESKIILLSLVRSNNENKTGFVSIKNRIIVSLSRAKHGLYIIGNSKLFSQTDEWFQIFQYFKEKNLLSDCMVMKCPNHPQTSTSIKNHFDLLSIEHGGCREICDYQFQCGHLCGPNYNSHKFQCNHVHNST
jgi:hypothetical protein